MFAKLRIGNADLDVGAVAEALVYYQKTSLTANAGSIATLVEKLGYDVVIEAIDCGALEITFQRHQYGVNSQNDGKVRVHDFVSFNLAATEHGEQISNEFEEIELQFRRRFGPSNETTLMAKTICDRVGVEPYMSEIIMSARSDLKDKSFVQAVVAEVFEELIPEYKGNRGFEITEFKNRFAVLSNIDFDEVNRIYHLRIPPSHSSVNDAFILAKIVAARNELIFGAETDADLWVNPSVSRIVQVRVNTLANRIAHPIENLSRFHDVVFDGKRFRDAINDGTRSGKELLELIKHPETTKFKGWLSKEAPDANLVEAYHRSIFANHSWFERLPGKSTKIVVCSGLGLAADSALGTPGLMTSLANFAADLALGASSDIVLPKMLKGWKPNQFIDGPAGEFLENR